MVKQGWIESVFVAIMVIAEFKNTVFVEGFKTSIENVSNKSSKIKAKNITRITGGEFAQSGDFPFQAVILVEGSIRCGGTVISNRHVLTAASCIYGESKESLSLYFKKTTVFPITVSDTARTVKNYSSHSNFDLNTLENDIAIISFAEPLNQDITPVKLDSSPNKSYNGKVATVVGWGFTNRVLYPGVEFFASNRLSQGKMTVIDNEDCGTVYHKNKQFFPHSVLLYTKRDKLLCATSFVGVSTCNFDKGGPILIDGIQVGISSYAAGCADPRYPAVFTRVGRYSKWIKNTMTKI